MCLAIVLLVQDWNSIAEWLIEELFDLEPNRLAFVALAGYPLFAQPLMAATDVTADALVIVAMLAN